ncbi:hypothetical protein D3C86_1385680 [compost metagenome]
MDHVERTISLRLYASGQSVKVPAPIASHVVPQHFDAIFWYGECVVTGIGKTAQTVAAIDLFRLDRAGLDDRIDICRYRCGAMGGVDRDFVAVRVTLEHGQLACRQLVLVLFGRGCRDDEQGFFVGKWVAQKAFAVDCAGCGGQASGPGRNAAVGAPGFDATHWRQCRA